MPRVELHYLPIDQHGYDIDLEAALTYLDDAEKQRYHRFKVEHARQCFLQARRIVKTQLAKRLDCKPHEITFAYSDTEKPYLVAPESDVNVEFNISHSQTTIIVAISEVLVGVDVEDIERCAKVWTKADTFLNPYVKSCVDKGRNEKESTSIFAEHWCCTEAYIKLKGSAIYREKDRVQALAHSNFSRGRRKTFEDSCFTVLNITNDASIAVATENVFPDVELVYWRTGERELIESSID